MIPSGYETKTRIKGITLFCSMIVRVLAEATSLTCFYPVLISFASLSDRWLFFVFSISVLCQLAFFFASHSAGYFFADCGHGSAVMMKDDDCFASFSNHFFPMLE